MKDLRQAVGTELNGHEEAAGLIGQYLTREAPPPPQSNSSAGTNRSQTPSHY
jgi:hypothetical protein